MKNKKSSKEKKWKHNNLNWLIAEWNYKGKMYDSQKKLSETESAGYAKKITL